MSPRRKKDDPKTSVVLLAELGVREAIAGLPRDLRGRMEDNVFIVTNIIIKSNEDILRKFDAIADLVLHGVVPAKVGDTVIKAISGAASAREKFINIDWPERMAKEVEERLTRFKQSYFAAAKAMMDEKQYEGFVKKFHELTGKEK